MLLIHSATWIACFEGLFVVDSYGSEKCMSLFKGTCDVWVLKNLGFQCVLQLRTTITTTVESFEVNVQDPDGALDPEFIGSAVSLCVLGSHRYPTMQTPLS